MWESIIIHNQETIEIGSRRDLKFGLNKFKSKIFNSNK